VATFNTVKQICAKWPEVTESTSYATPALKVRGKMFCRLWGERDWKKSDVQAKQVLVVYCEIDEKEFLLAESDGSVFSAPHYDGHGSVLIRLDDVDKDLLSSLLLESYLLQAPAALRREFDQD